MIPPWRRVAGLEERHVAAPSRASVAATASSAVSTSGSVATRTARRVAEDHTGRVARRSHATLRSSALAWWCVLAIFALLDVALTALALANGGRELNPLPAIAFAHGARVALVFKLAALALVLVLALQLEKRHAKWARAVLVTWTIVYVAVDLYSFTMLAEAGVFA